MDPARFQPLNTLTLKDSQSFCRQMAWWRLGHWLHRILLSCASLTVVSRTISWGGAARAQGWTGGQELGLKTRKSHKAGAGRTRPNEDSPTSLKLLSPGGGMMADASFFLCVSSLSFFFFWKKMSQNTTISNIIRETAVLLLAPMGFSFQYFYRIWVFLNGDCICFITKNKRQADRPKEHDLWLKQ